MPDLCQKCLCHFTLQPAICESSGCSATLPTLDVFSLLNFSHSGDRVMTFHCGFNLHFHMINDIKHRKMGKRKQK